MGKQMASLLNLSAFLFMASVTVVMVAVLWFVLNSPLGTPIIKRLAPMLMQRKQYAWAANYYEKLYHWQELMGSVSEYARQAGQCYEHLGDLKQALRWYEKAEDWAKVGQLSQEMGRLDEALEAFQKAQLPARQAFIYEQQENWLQAGLIYENGLHSWHKARLFYDKALQLPDLSPRDRIRTEFFIARLLVRQNKLQEAQQKLVGMRPLLEQYPEIVQAPEMRELYMSLRESLKS